MGGFGKSAIYVRRADIESNINMSWNSDVAASGAAMTKPFILI